MSTPGRNDPCPCGSGKKYKKCHGATSPAPNDSPYDRMRRLDVEASHRLLKFAGERYGSKSIESAWEEFHSGKGGPLSQDGPEFTFFMSWFEYGWQTEDAQPLARCYLSDRFSKKIEPEMRRLMETTLEAPYSFYQALEVEPGTGFKARDVLRDVEVFIVERKASEQIEKGHIMFARVVSLEEISFMMGSGTQVLRAVMLSDLQDVRKTLFPTGRPKGEPPVSKVLRDAEDYLRGVYFALVSAQSKSMTDIRNADGDPLVLQSLRYSIPAFDAAFMSLKDLELRATHSREEDLLTKDEVTDDGETIRARIHWLKGRGREGEGQSVLASITLTDGTMLVDVNSEKRSKLVQKEIKKRLGDSATLKHIDVAPASGMLKDDLKKPAPRSPQRVSEEQRRLKESPEAQMLLKTMLEKHWKTWPDTPIPALKGMTPRQAAKDKLGRELLESLLLEFEAHSAKEQDKSLKVDVEGLRRSLGLAELSEAPHPERRIETLRAVPRSSRPDIPPISPGRRANAAKWPTPPAVQLSTWQQLYAAAQRVQEMRPWELLDDLDPIIARNPSGGKTGHGVFMGSGGTLFGLCIYPGASGFYMYKDMIDGKMEIDGDAYFDTLDCLKVEFGPKGDLEPEDQSVIRRLGLSFRGQHAWPQFRSCIPGYIPWFISESEAKFLILCIEAGCHHCDRVGRGEIDESLGEGEYLVYTPASDPPGFVSQWEKWPERPSAEIPRPVLDIKRVNDLRSLRPAAGMAWEADVFRMPFPILDQERPYLPRMAAACDASTGIVLETGVFPAGESTPQLLVNLICSTAETNNMLPETIYVRGHLGEAALSPLSKMLGFQTHRRKRLKEIDKLKAAATKNMAR